MPVYQRANLAYLGGIPFTPVEQNAPNSVQFWSVSLGDNAAAAVYAAKTLKVKSVAVLYFDNSQGKVAGSGHPAADLQGGWGHERQAGRHPADDAGSSAEAAAAVGAHPDLIYVDIAERLRGGPQGPQEPRLQRQDDRPSTRARPPR